MNVHQLIERLENARIRFTMTTVRENAVMFQIAFPHERWEAEVFEDGHVKFEIFASTDGVIHGEDELISRIQQNAD